MQTAAESAVGSVCAIIAALVVGDRAALYDEVACATRIHTAAVAAAFICVIADLAAVHGEVSLNRIGVSYTYTGTTAKIIIRIICVCVAADLAAVHGKRAAVYIYTPAGVVTDLAAIHNERAVVYCNACTGVFCAIRPHAVGNIAVILFAAVAITEDKRSIDLDRVAFILADICERIAVQAEVKGLIFGHYDVLARCDIPR